MVLNIKWSKNEEGCLVAIWGTDQPDRPMIFQCVAAPVSPSRSGSGFQDVERRTLPKAA
jgi:hypothetical protein